MKKLFYLGLILIIGTLVGIVWYSSSKITTFEECENSWLVRSITFYDYTDSVPNAIEKECKLWSGKSFPKKQNFSNFGNDQIEKAITEYLLTQKYFSWKTTTDSHNFCVIRNLNPTKSGLFPLYIWVRCGEFALRDGELEELSGVSVPTKINYPNYLSFYDINKMSYEVPGDGSFYSKDIKTIFPIATQKAILNFDNANLNKKIEIIAISNLKQL